MGEQRPPGPLCTTQLGPDWIDKGTLCLQRSNPPGPTGLGYRGPGAFPHISRTRFVKHLRELIDGSRAINQGNSSLCGPAALVYCWIKKFPLEFAYYALQLYKYGKGSMGRLLVQPGHGCRNFTPTQGPTPQGNIIDVDWVVLASLRDSENGFLPYDHEERQLAGITMPSTMAKWFEHIGFVVQDQTNLFNAGSPMHRLKLLIDAADNFSKSNTSMVCLLVNADPFRGKVTSTEDFVYYTTGENPEERRWPVSKIPNHWVVLTSEIEIGGQQARSLHPEEHLLNQPIFFTVFTWGWPNRPVNQDRQSNPPTVKEFLLNFMGHIVVK
jgi:hypothetical protein